MTQFLMLVPAIMHFLLQQRLSDSFQVPKHLKQNQSPSEYTRLQTTVTLWTCVLIDLINTIQRERQFLCIPCMHTQTTPPA